MVLLLLHYYASMPGKKTWHTHSILTHTNKDSWMFVLFCYFPFFHCIRDGFFLQFIYWLLFSSLSFCCSVFSFCFTCFFLCCCFFLCGVCYFPPFWCRREGIAAQTWNKWIKVQRGVAQGELVKLLKKAVEMAVFKTRGTNPQEKINEAKNFRGSNKTGVRSQES